MYPEERRGFFSAVRLVFFAASVGLKLVENRGHSAVIVSGMLELSLPPILLAHGRAEIRKL